MSRDPRWEVVQTDVGHHIRFRAANGKVIVTSEVYTRRRAALNAIELLTGPIVASPFADWPEVYMAGYEWPIEVRDVDEREAW